MAALWCRYSSFHDCSGTQHKAFLMLLDHSRVVKTFAKELNNEMGERLLMFLVALEEERTKERRQVDRIEKESIHNRKTT